MMSLVPPGGKGTMNVIGLLGNAFASSANAGPAAATKPNASAAARDQTGVYISLSPSIPSVMLLLAAVACLAGPCPQTLLGKGPLPIMWNQCLYSGR